MRAATPRFGAEERVVREDRAVGGRSAGVRDGTPFTLGRMPCPCCLAVHWLLPDGADYGSADGQGLGHSQAMRFTVCPYCLFVPAALRPAGRLAWLPPNGVSQYEAAATGGTATAGSLSAAVHHGAGPAVDLRAVSRHGLPRTGGSDPIFTVVFEVCDGLLWPRLTSCGGTLAVVRGVGGTSGVLDQGRDLSPDPSRLVAGGVVDPGTRAQVRSAPPVGAEALASPTPKPRRPEGCQYSDQTAELSVSCGW